MTKKTVELIKKCFTVGFICGGFVLLTFFLANNNSNYIGNILFVWIPAIILYMGYVVISFILIRFVSNDVFSELSLISICILLMMNMLIIWIT